MQNILFITTTNLTTNPRLLKEVKLALTNGIIPTVVLFDFDNWTTAIEKELRASLPGVKFFPITATRKAFRNWVLATGLQILCRRLYGLLPSSKRTSAYASDKRSFLLARQLKRLNSKFDLVISHNLGALYPAYAFSKTTKTPFAFDIEDFHPGETVAVDGENEVERRKELMKKLLIKAIYVSYASPLIGKASLALLPEPKRINHFLINNSFSTNEFHRPLAPAGEKLRFVWFSQNIAAGRGLELVVPILYDYRDRVELTLIGNLVPSFYESFLKPFDECIQYHLPLTQPALHYTLANFDVGLAVDLKEADLNRAICLTNKIFAYAQAGLYVMATDTEAQALFIEQNPILGIALEQTEAGFEEALKALLAHKEEVLATKQQRFEAGKQLSWEKEASKLLTVWKSVQEKDL